MYSTAEAARLILQHMQEQCLLKFERRDLVMWMRTVHSSQCNDCISEEAIDMLAAEGTVESLGDIIVLEN